MSDLSAGASPSPGEASEIISYVATAAGEWFEGLGDAPVAPEGFERAAAALGGRLPEYGDGGAAALRALVEGSLGGAVRSSGPRFFHFVTGGVTPAALGADWIASLIDQNPVAWIASPLAAQLEVVALSWLKDLFGLPPPWGGVLTTGATMANFTALACARRWWGLRHGVDVDEKGVASLPQMPVLSSGYVHPSALKALAMLGIGRAQVQTFARDAAGRLDFAAMEHALEHLDPAPAVIIANAGEVNAGDFDPIADMADLAAAHSAWLHVDGAFGLFAGVSHRSAHLVHGVDRASSVIADGHKWLNVPYDCGYAFVADADLLRGPFALSAAYLESLQNSNPSFGVLGPETSRRARSLAVWATLRAYGRDGYRAIVERHLDLARHLAARVDQAPDLERLADVPLNIVCFRWHPPGVPEDRLNDLNRRLADALLADGRVFVGSTIYEGKVALRPAIVNWMTAEGDVDLLVDVVRGVGTLLHGA